ncbi:MAG: CotH kinase family protein [Verrucomicrobiae bacterium]|nr:CotH kinase family protein [Verrucomicrobiae bacterium]
MPFPRPKLPKSGWKRWLAVSGLAAGGFFLCILLLGLSLWGAFQVPAFQGWFMARMVEWTPPATPEETPGQPGVVPVYAGPLDDARELTSAAALYRLTNVWNIHLRFDADGWEGIQHQRVPTGGRWMNPDGSMTLRNPNASRNGLSGVVGIDFPWSEGTVEFGGVVFTNVGIRFKGNGTYLGSVRSYRKPFKLDLNRNVKGASLAGRSTFNLANLAADFTCLSDTLAYEVFREAGVPAPRTAFARVFLSIKGLEEERLLGPYLLVENPDAAWAREQFGASGVALFKPVTLDLFADLGTNWADYEGIYDPKTRTTPAQQERVMELARFVSSAPDDAFADRVGDYVDLDAFARFLATEVLLSNYDGILSNGQNFLFHLDPRSNRIGFIPWDLDHAWGEFPFIATADDRERASIWRPWVGRNRFLERMLSVEEVRIRYREALGRLLDTVFEPDRLCRRVDEVAPAIRPLIVEWSPMRLERFDAAVSGTFGTEPRDGRNPMDPGRPVWQLKRFIQARAANVREQLEGRTDGVVLTRQPPGRNQ